MPKKLRKSRRITEVIIMGGNALSVPKEKIVASEIVASGYAATSYSDCPYVSGQRNKSYWDEGFVTGCADRGNIPEDTDMYLRGRIAYLMGADIADFPKCNPLSPRWMSGWLMQQTLSTQQLEREKRLFSEKFNGEIVGQITGLSGNNLGLLITAIRRSFLTEAHFRRWVLSSSDEEVRGMIEKAKGVFSTTQTIPTIPTVPTVPTVPTIPTR
jgi:hypothetical protein